MRHKAMYRCVAVALIVLFTPWVLAQEDKDVKLALIADKAFDLHKSPLVSLLEVRLSQKEHVLLLERAQIDKLLQEQKLSIAGLRQRDTVLKLGRLLRADAFLLLSIENGKDEKKDEKELLRVRLVETAHGLRLLDSFEQLDNTKPLETAERIAEKVFGTAGKLLVPPSKAIPVGTVGIHRVQFGERYGWLTRTLPIMLSQFLSRQGLCFTFSAFIPANPATLNTFSFVNPNLSHNSIYRNFLCLNQVQKGADFHANW